jgi:4-amino-4-deoxy-L-arabinose transferase-like glycosyltransferase
MLATGPADRPHPDRALIAGSLTIVLATALASRIAALFLVGNVPTLHGDEQYYVAAARSIAGGLGYPGSARPPGFPAFLAVALAIGGDHLLAARCAQLAVSLAGVGLVFAIARASFGLRAGLLSGLVAAAHPTLVHYSHFLWAEPLVATLLLAVVWWCDRWSRTQLARFALLAGVALGAAALVRDMLLPFAALVALWMVAAAGVPRRRALVASSLLLVTVAACAAPWMARNARLHGTFVGVATTRWLAIAQGNLLPPWAEITASGSGTAFGRDYNAIGDELARERLARNVALLAIYEEQPGWIAKKLVRNTYLLWAPDGQLERFARKGWLLPSGSGATAVLVAVDRWYYVVATLLGIAGIWLAPPRRITSLIAVLLSGHIAIYVLANANHRFRVPLLPLLCLYVGPLLASRDGDRVARWRIAGAAICFAILVAVVAAAGLAGADMRGD